MRDVSADLVEAGEFDGAELVDEKATSARHVTSEVEPRHRVNAEHQQVEHLHSHSALQAHDCRHLYRR